MSMLSAQCDELRELALWLDDEFYDAEATKVRDAADTIWELRDDLQRANAENASLRERVDAAHMSRLLTENENESLRELVRKVFQFERAGCEGCPYASTCDADCLYDPDCPMREDIERDMRELGVDE